MHRLVGNALEIRLARPEKRNAIDREMAEGIDRAFAALDSTPEARAAILVAEGPVFSAGTDMSDPSDKRTLHGGEYGLLRRERSKPLIAVVDGPALGGGFEIVLACDIVVAGTAAEFGLPETRRGVIPTGGGLFRAPRSLPRHIAMELLLTGRRLSAERAHALGLVNALVPSAELMGTAHGFVRDIARAGPFATAETLAAVRGAEMNSEQPGWWATGRAKQAVIAHPEAAEGRQAFLQRRPPAWAAETEE